MSRIKKDLGIIVDVYDDEAIICSKINHLFMLVFPSLVTHS